MKSKTSKPNLWKQFKRSLLLLLLAAVAVESYLLCQVYSSRQDGVDGKPEDAEGSAAVPVIPSAPPTGNGQETAGLDVAAELAALRREMNTSIADAWVRIRREADDREAAEEQWFGFGYHPKADVEDLGDTYVINIDMPGTSAEELSVQLDGLEITISGTRDLVIKDGADDARLIRRERFQGKFERSFTLPSPVASDEIDVSLADGILSIWVPKGKDADVVRTFPVL